MAEIEVPRRVRATIISRVDHDRPPMIHIIPILGRTAAITPLHRLTRVGEEEEEATITKREAVDRKKRCLLLLLPGGVFPLPPSCTVPLNPRSLTIDTVPRLHRPGAMIDTITADRRATTLGAADHPHHPCT